MEVEGGLKLVAIGKKRKGSQVTGEQRTERSMKRGEKKGGVGESTWRGEPYKERERKASSSSCTKSHARRNGAMGAKVATKIGICVSKSGCFNCPIALWPCAFCIPEVTLIYAMPLKRRLLGRMLAYLQQLVHDSSHAERAPPTKIGAAISLRRPEARRPLVSQGEGTGGGMGGGRVQSLFHPLSSPSSTSP